MDGASVEPDVLPARAPGDLSGWKRYYTRDATMSVGAELRLGEQSGSVGLDADADFRADEAPSAGSGRWFRRRGGAKADWRHGPGHRSRRPLVIDGTDGAQSTDGQVYPAPLSTPDGVVVSELPGAGSFQAGPQSIYVTAYDAYGETTDRTPSVVWVTTSGSRLQVSWNPVHGAIGYRIYWINGGGIPSSWHMRNGNQGETTDSSLVLTTICCTYISLPAGNTSSRPCRAPTSSTLLSGCRTAEPSPLLLRHH